MRRCAARRSTSTSLIQTYPGAPVQQFPHWLHVNFSPSANQGFSATSMTSNFIGRHCRQLSGAVGVCKVRHTEELRMVARPLVLLALALLLGCQHQPRVSAAAGSPPPVAAPTTAPTTRPV